MGGALTEEELLHAFTKMTQIGCFPKVFVETGTYKGHTSRMASKYFNTVHTIEIFEPLYNEAKEWGAKDGITNIVYHLGDTMKLLPGIVKNVNEPAFYFIDAHISGSDSSWNGVKTVPLMDELKAVLENTTHSFVVCFDDLRLFNLPPDWSGIHCQSILDFIKSYKRNPIDNYVENDRFFVYVK